MISKGSTLFLKLAVIGMAVLTVFICIVIFSEAINREDPELGNERYLFFALPYLMAFPFLLSLTQVFKLLVNVDSNKAFSESSIKALGIIKYCAMSVIGWIFLGELGVVISSHGDEDIAGVVAMGIYASFAAIAVVIFASVLQKIVKNGMDLKLESELTI